MPGRFFYYICFVSKPAMDMKKNESQLLSFDEDFLNNRGRDELFASNAYRYAATCALRLGLDGFVKFFRAESKDELKHRTILEEYADNFNFELDVPSIPAVEFGVKEKKDTKMYVMGILEYLLDMEMDLLQEYETGTYKCARAATKKLCYDMVGIQTEGVGGINKLIAELDSTEIGEMNLRLLSA